MAENINGRVYDFTFNPNTGNRRFLRVRKAFNDLFGLNYQWTMENEETGAEHTIFTNSDTWNERVKKHWQNFISR